MRVDPGAWEAFDHLLEQPGGLVVVGHRNPDGDCLGVMSAICQIADQSGGRVIPISADPIPQHYRFLPFMNDVQISNKYDCGHMPVILLECGTTERSGVQFEDTGTVVNLDHHPDNTGYGDIVLLDETASSIGEMMALHVLEETSIPVTPGIADALYVAIHTDTGGFSYGNTSTAALQVAAGLVDAGARVDQVCAAVYQEQNINRLKLLGEFLSRLKTYESGRIGVGKLFLSDLEQFNCTREDTDGFSAYPRAIDGVEIGIFLLETGPARFKVSLRSKGNAVVNRAASRFGGGGHEKAAGFSCTGDAENIIVSTVDAIRETNEQ